MGTSRPLRIGVLVFDDADAVDIAGTHEVLSCWADQTTSRSDVLTFSADGAGVRLARGLLLVPEVAASGVGPLHVLVHPGGPGAVRLAADPDHLALLRALRREIPLLAALSDGALALASAGLLAGRPSSGSPASVAAFSAADPSTVVDTRSGVVDDGDVVTAAGLTAGIDLALRLVARLDSPAAAQRTADELGYARG